MGTYILEFPMKHEISSHTQHIPVVHGLTNLDENIINVNHWQRFRKCETLQVCWGKFYAVNWKWSIQDPPPPRKTQHNAKFNNIHCRPMHNNSYFPNKVRIYSYPRSFVWLSYFLVIGALTLRAKHSYCVWLYINMYNEDSRKKRFLAGGGGGNCLQKCNSFLIGRSIVAILVWVHSIRPDSDAVDQYFLDEWQSLNSRGEGVRGAASIVVNFTVMNLICGIDVNHVQE